MSKIQINELAQNSSNFEVLNAAETTEVVGGGKYKGWKGYKYYYSSYYSDDDVVIIDQDNNNYTQQVAFGGGKKSNTSNFNNTNQQNYANVYA